MGATGWICAIWAWACIAVGAQNNLRIDKGIGGWTALFLVRYMHMCLASPPPLASSFDPIPLILRKGANLT